MKKGAVGDTESTDLGTGNDVQETEIQIPTSRVSFPQLLRFGGTTWPATQKAHIHSVSDR